ncbi:MAG: Hpt domain-containing protein [Planctomycetes bacterium]|nr:Hpt domain-containing protein [Planctomycetota bacterium]
MTDPAIDMDIVQELLDISGEDDPELLVDLIDMFLEDGPLKVQTILEGLAAGDLDAVERAAHALKSSAGNLGASYVQDLAEQLQIAGHNRDAVAARACADQLRSRFTEAEQALREIRGRFGL